MKYLFVATASAVFALALFADWFIRTFSLPLAVLLAIGIVGCVLDVLLPPKGEKS